MFAVRQAATTVTAPLAGSNNPPSRNPFEAARSQMIRRLVDLAVPKAYPSFPSPSDHEGVAAHIREAADIFDEWLHAIGFEVRDNAHCAISKDLFAGSFTGAIDGNETWACEEAAGEARSYRRAR